MFIPDGQGVMSADCDVTVFWSLRDPAEQSWPKGRKTTLETLRAAVRIYVGDERAILKQISDSVRVVESWW